MNIKKAFTIRSRLNKYAKDLSIQLTAVSLEVPESTQFSDKIDAAYEQLNKSIEALAKLNALIDKANGNSEARYNISKQEGLKNLVHRIESFALTQRDFIPEREEYDQYRCDENGNKGAYVIKKYKLNTKIDWISELKKVKKELVKLQDDLDEINSKIEVDVPEDIIEFYNSII